MSAPGTANHGAGIAILGGSFDPPHATHRRLARLALLHLPVSEVRVVPAGDHPHKQDRAMTAAHHRLAMCRLAFADLAGICIDDREMHRRGLSFTVDTLAEIHAEQPGRALYFLIGSDNLPLLPSWHHHHRLMQLATIVTYPRAGHACSAEVLANLPLSPAERASLLANVLPLPADDIAATTIRTRWRHGERDLPGLAPAVARYIAEHSLYGA